MTTYEIIMIMLTCLTLIISLLTLVVRLLLIIIDNTYYKISIGPDIGTTLNNNSKILKITDDEVVFTYNLDNDTKKKRLTVKSENKDIHFKLEDIN